MEVSKEELHVLLHSLGLGYGVKVPYRNHFLSGPGHADQPYIDSLVDKGLMVNSRPGTHWYHVTPEGQKLVTELQRIMQ